MTETLLLNLFVELGDVHYNLSKIPEYPIYIEQEQECTARQGTYFT